MTLALFALATLVPVKSLSLPAPVDPVGQALGTPVGLFVASFQRLSQEGPKGPRLWLLDRQGGLLKEVETESFGLERPGNLVWTGQELVLADVVKSTVVALDEKLQKKQLLLLRGRHPSPTMTWWLAYNPQEKLLLATGCHPLHGYADQGCWEVHEFSFPQGEHRRSGLELPPWRQEWGQMPVSWQWVVGVSPQGATWVVAEAAGKGFRRLPRSEKWERLNFGPYAFQAPAYPQDKEQLESALDQAYLATALCFSPRGEVVVAYTCTACGQSRLVVFSAQGKALAQLSLPERVVGSDGDLLLTAKKEGTWKLTWYRWE
jgi:hypothetical protein